MPFSLHIGKIRICLHPLYLQLIKGFKSLCGRWITNKHYSRECFKFMDKKMLYFCLCHSFLNCEARELKRAWPTRANDSQNAKALLRVNGQRGALAFQNKVTICFLGGPQTGRCDLWLGSALQGPSRICFLACLSCNEWDLEGFNLSAQRTNCLITFSDADWETSLFQWFS